MCTATIYAGCILIAKNTKFQAQTRLQTRLQPSFVSLEFFAIATVTAATRGMSFKIKILSQFDNKSTLPGWHEILLHLLIGKEPLSERNRTVTGIAVCSVADSCSCYDEHSGTALDEFHQPAHHQHVAWTVTDVNYTDCRRSVCCWAHRFLAWLRRSGQQPHQQSIRTPLDRLSDFDDVDVQHLQARCQLFFITYHWLIVYTSL